MQSVNGAQFLNTTSLPSLSYSAGASTCAIDIVPLKSIYSSLKPHKLDLSIEVLSLI